ncbi:plasmid mobilization protein [Mucilaginibacter sp.]
MEINDINNAQPSSRQKNKGGAPKKKIKREEHVMVRLTVTERFLIENKAKLASMKLSDWFRSAAKSAKIVPRLSSEDRSILHMLAGMANNINQIAKLAHKEGILTVVRKCDAILTEIDSTLKYLNRDDL